MKESKLYLGIMHEGELAAGRENLLKVVKNRLGAEFAAEVTATINAMDDGTRLEQLFDALLLRGMSQDDFRTAPDDEREWRLRRKKTVSRPARTVEPSPEVPWRQGEVVS